jgi:tetratricopeptide (TPR) repeat protein
VCRAVREARAQRQGLAVSAGLLVAVLVAAALVDLGETTLLARLALWLLALEVACTVVHELGHATAAVLLGFRLYHLSFGYGPVLAARRFGRALFELRSYPVCGFVRVASRAPALQRGRHALVSLAGPATNAALLALAWSQLPAGLTVESPWAVTPWHLLFGVNAVILAVNLFPLKFPTDADLSTWQPNDGLSTLAALGASGARVRAWIAGAVALEAQERRARGDAAGAAAILDEAPADVQEAPDLQLVRAVLAAEARPGGTASQQAQDRLAAIAADADLPVRLRVDAGVALAELALATNDVDEADRRVRAAHALSPESLPLRRWRAEIALLRGAPAQAAPFLSGLEEVGLDPGERAEALALLARARSAEGRPEEGRALLERARALDPTAPGLARAERALEDR